MSFDWPFARRLAGASTLAVAVAAAPQNARACACGCGLFDVGTASMFPTASGAMTFLEYDLMDQNENWSGTSHAPSAANPDKRIRTDFFTAGVQSTFDRAWAVTLEVPYWRREFATTADGGAAATYTHAALGDVRVKATYTGLSGDMSTGFTFGIKLPTGDKSYPGFDADTEIGTGSTDLLLGGYHMGDVSDDGEWRYFAQVQWDRPVAHDAAYAPGAEWSATAGIYREGWRFGQTAKIAPVLQLDGSVRGHDGGPLGDAANSGYARVLATPGAEIALGPWTIFADVGFQLYANVVGDQLVSRRLYRVNLGYRF